MFEFVLFLVSVFAGAIASVAGFGIGSLLTPLLATRFDTKTAVALVAVPHAAATALRLWRLRGHVRKDLFVRFGLPSAAGGLFGALLHGVIQGRGLSAVLGVLLLTTAWTVYRRTPLPGLKRFPMPAGFLSGVFGGLVGNQGGVRSGALSAFGLDRMSFVAVATASAMVVDGARLPVYAALEGGAMREFAPLLWIMAAGAWTGTIFGERVLRRMTDRAFELSISALLASLGVYMLTRAL